MDITWTLRPGTGIEDVAKKMIAVAEILDVPVTATFNGVKLEVKPCSHTDPQQIKDYYLKQLYHQ